MKRISLLILALQLLHCGSLFTQDLLDPPKLNIINSSSVINRSTDFFLGWNWGSPGRKLDSALNINFYHGAPYKDADIISNLRTAEPVPNIVYSRVSDVVLNAMAIQYEPTLDLSLFGTPGYKFTPREGDNQGGVFGFKNRFDPYIINNSGPNFNKIIFPDSNAIYFPLGLTETGTSLRYLDYDANDSLRSGHGVKNRTNDSLLYLDIERDISTYYPFNGKQYYLSINLNAMNADSLLNHLNDTLLAVIWQYKKVTIDNPDSNNVINETWSYVKFDRMPANDTLSSNIEEIFSHPSVTDSVFRGYAKNTVADSSQPDEFYITGKMLYNSKADSINSPITISALALFTGVKDNGVFENNPHFKPDWWKNSYSIKEFITMSNIIVAITGEVELAVDWIRIETPRAQDLFRGKYDDTIRTEITKLLNSYSLNSKNPKIHRFYANDEVLDYEWQATRYFNTLVDTLANTELYFKENPITQYSHSTMVPELWAGDSPRLNKWMVNVPYVKQAFITKSPDNNEILSTFNYQAGYNGGVHATYSPHHYVVNDTLNSDYETHSIFYGMHGDEALPIFWNKPYLYDRILWARLCNEVFRCSIVT